MENKSIFTRQNQTLNTLFRDAGHPEKVLCIPLDYAKTTHVALCCNGSGTVLKKAFPVKNNLKGIAFLIEVAEGICRKHHIKREHIFFGGEDCGTFSLNFIYGLREQGFTVIGVNAKDAKEQRENMQASSDELDLLGIAKVLLNRRVITPDFNRVICEELAQELDPFSDEKAMIFCVTDLHADMVKNQLDDEFKKLYGDDYNQNAVRKITGASDQVDKLIRHYKNEHYPSIAITVDLLTTGIDVPKICHLVFLRRVRSRILYEQMVGRATRRCDEIGKTEFKIYDPVDLYAALDEVSTMKPLVKNPNIPLEQLIDELMQPEHHAQVESRERTHADEVLDAINQKVMRVLRKANKKAERDGRVRDKLQDLEEQWGVKPHELHKHFHEIGPEKAAEFLKAHSGFIQQLDDVKELVGSENRPIISYDEDELTGREQNFGIHQRPGDYLDHFAEFVKGHINDNAALSAVVNRPKDLTREQLKEVRLYLDQNGFSESSLKAAWRGQTNQEIAASIIGYIRKAALGEALIPFERRVETAMENIYGMRNWTTVQRKWLDRLAKQLNHEVVIDQQAVNIIFSGDGGAKRLDMILHKQLDSVLETLADSLWEQAV